MKRLLIVLVLAGGAIAGCSGVIVNAKYSAKIDQTAAWAKVVATRAAAGQLTPADMATALNTSADHWADIKDAKDGKVQP